MGSMNVLAIDPGKGKRTGSALFYESRLLDVRNGLFITAELRGVHEIVIEMPRWYPHERKIDVNDLLDLAELVGEYARTYHYCGPVTLVHPVKWKGSVPKKIHQPRILNALDREERALMEKTKDHNIIDAVGIGLWKLGRL